VRENDDHCLARGGIRVTEGFQVFRKATCLALELGLVDVHDESLQDIKGYIGGYELSFLLLHLHFDDFD